MEASCSDFFYFCLYLDLIQFRIFINNESLQTLQAFGIAIYKPYKLGSLQFIQSTVMRLSNGIISILQKILFISVVAILIVIFLELVFIGKNITFTTRFTPLQSEENHLRNETYITEAQSLIVVLCIFYAFILPFSMYAAVKQSKRIFLPVLLGVVGTNGLLVFLNLYFLTGAKAYRNYMQQQYHDVVQNSGICQNEKATLCMVGTCARLQTFEQARSMAISFTVINSVFSLIYTIVSILCNKRRKDAEKLQLIV